MAVCLMNPIETHEAKNNKCALKLLGIGRFELIDEDILECVSKYIEPKCIEALFFDTYNNFYVLFLNDIDATCRLVGKIIDFRNFSISIYPLIECYVIDNVYPCLRNEELRDIFRTFGNVFTISNHHVVPNSSKFSHVLSGKREITFLLPGEDSEIYIPINVVHPPYSFNVKKFCCACLTEGHSVLYCPDIEDDDEFPKIKKIKKVESDSDGELEALIKSEYIDFDDTKVEDPLPDTPSCDNSSRPIQKTASCLPFRTIEIAGVRTAAETSQEMDTVEEPEVDTVNPEERDKSKKPEPLKEVSQEEIHPKSMTTLTEVVSTSKGSYFRATDSGLFSAYR